MKTPPKTIRAVHANVGVKVRYRKQLDSLIKEMSQSIEYWLIAAYRATPPRIAALVALDATPAQDINKQLRKLALRWLKRFDLAAPKIAEAYLRGSYKASDSAMRAALKDAGFAIEFKMTPAMNDAFQASLAENVGLIRSIPEQYLGKIEGIVNRSYAAGRDLETMVASIRKVYPVTKRRAVLISRDQSNKANAVVIRTRQLELGLTQAIWMHSHAGKTPRPEHVAANGKPFDIAKGFWMAKEGKWVQPGEDINCRCTSRAILSSLVA